MPHAPCPMPHAPCPCSDGIIPQANLGNPDLLLFWASNSLKLTGSLLQDPGVFSTTPRVLALYRGLIHPCPGTFQTQAKPQVDKTVDKCLAGIDSCAKQGEHPAELAG
jgi:hypothetical protein